MCLLVNGVRTELFLSRRHSRVIDPSRLCLPSQLISLFLGPRSHGRQRGAVRYRLEDDANTFVKFCIQISRSF